MMPLRAVESHEEYRQRVRRFVEERLAPNAEAWERAGRFPVEILAELGGAGLLGRGYAEDYGGGGGDFGHHVVLAEELPRSRMMGLTVSVMVQDTFATYIIAQFGTEEQKREFLAPAIRGERIGALAVTEPTGGSDLAGAIQCTAEPDGECWVVTGEKKFITNGPIADYLLLLVRTRPGRSLSNFMLLLFPTSTPGFRVIAELDKLGLRTSPTGWLRFEGCRVPRRYTIGREHCGLFYVNHGLLVERLLGSVAGLAGARLVFADTCAHLRTRRAFDRSLAQFQVIRHRMSELAARIEMSSRFTYDICQEVCQGRRDAMRISMLKFAVYEIVQHVVDQCLQLHGGNGFLEDNWIARVYRDVKVLTIFAGSSEMMKDTVAAYLGL